MPGNIRGELVGRDGEVTRLRKMLDATVEGAGGALVIRGEAGVGKTALLDLVRREADARGLLVLGARGSESESEAAFAGLHQALRPVLDEHIGSLSASLQKALRVALWHEDGFADLQRVALATLELVVEASDRRPVVILLDDLHWFDTPSLTALAFLARRVEGESVLVLGTTRTLELNDPLRRNGFTEMYVQGLDARSAASLLDACTPGLSTPLRQRVLREAAGNPLALIELPRSWDLLVSPSIVPVNARLQVAFAARLDTVSERTRVLLATLAADSTCNPGQYLAAASEACGQPVGAREVQEAIDAGLIDLVDEELRFRHPLMRSAVYSCVPVTTRLAAHAALANQFAALPDRRLWHQSQAVLGTDEALATRLEEQATSARRRGMLTVAIAALRRAAALVEAPARRTSLFLYAAELACEVGHRSAAVELADRADPALMGPAERGRLTLVHEITAPRDFRDETRVEELISHACAAQETGATILAVNLLWRAASRCNWARLSTRVRQKVAATADRMRLEPGDPRRLATLALVMPEVYGRKALAAMRRLPAADGGLETSRYLCSAAIAVGDYHSASSYARAAAKVSRESGQHAVMSRTLGTASWCRIWTGEWDLVRTGAAEAGELAEDMGNAFWGLSAKINFAMLAAQRGDSATAEELALEAQSSPLIRGAAFMQCAALTTLGVAAAVAGHPEKALGRLRRVFDPADPAFHELRWRAAPHLADAARVLGRQEEARSLLAGLEEAADRLPSPMLRMCRAYVRAVLADDGTCEELFDQALSGEIARWPLDRGRLLLTQGSWLRRSHRVAQSREPLREARDTFDALGARYWSERARQELRAAGEDSERPADPVGDILSPQELQIASLAAEGLTNREIAVRLFMSHRTVGTHLYRIFPKLGITKRGQLGATLRSVSANGWEPNQ
ncbi:BREX system ATP-binding domain-containing protein [Streptomyces sp. NPDC004658]|uniref:helix-turn-helix transcriptional regulator n=1 Tax=Streptomyces sp. NPDC004658 TaxID=3154672 RepID=UPI0033AA98F5